MFMIHILFPPRQTKTEFSDQPPHNLNGHIQSKLVSFSRRQKGVQRGEVSEAVQLFEQF